MVNAWLQTKARRSLGWLLLLVGVALLTGCTNRINANVALAAPAETVVGGDPAAGEAALLRYGCGSCHTIAGVPGARGLVGPPLTGIGDRAYLAGILPTTPDNMATWIMHPQAIAPGNAMPDLGVSDEDARDMVAYLYRTQAGAWWLGGQR